MIVVILLVLVVFESANVILIERFWNTGVLVVLPVILIVYRITVPFTGHDVLVLFVSSTHDGFALSPLHVKLTVADPPFGVKYQVGFTYVMLLANGIYVELYWLSVLLNTVAAPESEYVNLTSWSLVWLVHETPA